MRRRLAGSARAWGGRAASSLLFLAPATALSVVRMGHAFNTVNNAYHIPIVLGFARLPQFADDPFVQSLSRFVSPVYRALALVATEANVEMLFLAGLALAHFLTLLSLLRVAEATGLRGLGERAALVAVAAASWQLYGSSTIGGDGLNTFYFSHTELARATATLGLAAALTGRFVHAGFLGGLAFALNVFVGVWATVPLAAAGLHHLWTADGRAERQARLRRLLAGAAAFALPAVPVALWVLVVVSGPPPTFDHREFLRGIYPPHFFIDAVGGWSLRSYASSVVSGVLAALLLTRVRGPALAVLGGLVVLFAGGVLVGLFSSSRLLLNLHILRVDGMTSLFCLALTAAATIVALRGGRPLALLASLLALYGLADGKWLLAALAMLLLHADRRLSGQKVLSVLAASRGALLLAALAVPVAVAGAVAGWRERHAPVAGIPTNVQLRGTRPAAAEWLEVQRWARAETPVETMFLVPQHLQSFRVGARRRVWSSGDDGAVGFWDPEAYATLRQRHDQVATLDGPEAMERYACTHGISFMVLDLRARGGAPFDAARTAFRNRWFEVQRPRCTSGAPRS